MAFPERIVCLTEETTETLYLLGEQHRIVGISGFTVRPKEARQTKPKVSLFTDAKIDEILDLNPDLVIGFSDIQADISKELIQKGLNVWTFNQRSIEEIRDVIRIMSLTVDAKAKGEMLLQKINNNLDAIKQTSAQLNKRPKVFFEEWPDPLISGIKWVSELTEWAGGVDVFHGLSDEPLAKYRIIEDPSAVIEQNPDIIIGSWCGKMVKPDKIKARPGWENITAIQNDDIYEVHSSIILQPGPAALLEGVNALQEIILKWANR